MTYIIAEIGVNWQGNLAIAEDMISEAAACGADAVKFQLYNPYDIFGVDGTHPSLDALTHALSMELKEGDVERLQRRASDEWVHFSCSVFDHMRFRWLKKLNPPFYKIASRTAATNPQLVSAVLREGRPTYISDGMGWAEDYIMDNVRKLFCISQYPAYNVQLPPTFGGIDDEYYGYSHHSIGPELAIEAIERGAKAVEVHFTLSKSLEGPDHQLSVTPRELALLTL